MRAWDLILVIGLFTGIMVVFDNPLTGDLFDGTNVVTQGSIVSQSDFVTSDTISDTSGTLDYFVLAAKMAWSAMLMLLVMLTKLIFAYTMIVNLLGGSPEAYIIGGFIQIGIWMIEAIALYQIFTKVSIEGMA